MKKKFAFFGLLLVSKFSIAQLQPQDPFSASLGTPTHELRVRVIQHGLKGREALINEQLRAAEVVYSQCPGMVLKINVVEQLQMPADTAQEHTSDYVGSQDFLNQKFLDMMKPNAADRSNDGVLDLHMHEFLNEEIRRTKQVTGQINFGQSFNSSILNIIFLDPRPEAERTPSLDELVGNSLHLAIETVALNRSGGVKYKDKTSHPRNLSLLAHEMGHLLLESYDPIKKWYGDHWCPATNQTCPEGFLMTGGGNDDNSYTDPKKNKIMGFDALPKLDAIQCDRFLNSTHVKRL